MPLALAQFICSFAGSNTPGNQAVVDEHHQGPGKQTQHQGLEEGVDRRRPVSPGPRNVEGCLVDVGRGHRRGGVPEHARPPAGTRGHLENMLASEPVNETGADGQQVALALWPGVHLVICGCPVTVIVLGSGSRIHAFQRIAGAVGQTGTGPPWLCTMAAPANANRRTDAAGPPTRPRAWCGSASCSRTRRCPAARAPGRRPSASSRRTAVPGRRPRPG